MRTAVWGLVPAAGRGRRFGCATPKLLIEVAGRPLLSWTLERLLSCGLDGLTVAVAAESLETVAARVSNDPRVAWIAGGETRQASVAACLQASPADRGWILVHDGARAAVAVEDVWATIDAALAGDGAVLGRPVVDTLKRLAGDTIAATVDRSDLFRAETPQVFRREVLERAFLKAGSEGYLGTDEASLVERLPGVALRAVAARRPNPKLTARRDLAQFDVLLAGGGSP